MNLPKNKTLGKLCKRGHDYQGTGKSLRTTGSRSCCECLKISGANDKLVKQLVHYDHKHPRISEWRKNLVDLDPAEIRAAIKEAKAKQKRKTFWGKPCKHGHVNADGLTERYLAAGRACVECTRIRHSKRQEELKELTATKTDQEPSKQERESRTKYEFPKPVNIDLIRSRYADYNKMQRQWEVEDRLKSKKAG